MKTKTCFKCGLTQPLSSFYKHKAMSDGHLNKCKSCTKKDTLANQAKNDVRTRVYKRANVTLRHATEAGVDIDDSIETRKMTQLIHEFAIRAEAITGERWSLDHRKPMSKGGAHHWSNIQPMLLFDNKSKGDKYAPVHHATYEADVG